MNLSIAVLGVDTPIGQALLEQLAETDFPFDSIQIVAENADVADSALLGNKQLPVEDVAAFNWEQVQLAFFACSAAESARYAPLAAAAGCVVFDLSGRFANDPAIPLVTHGVNDYALAEFRSSYIIANPDSAAVQISRALKPVYDTLGIDRINLTCFQPASVVGKAGVDELAGQTASLLNGRPVEAKVFPKQLAFNLIPASGELLDNGYSRSEMAVIEQTQRLFEDPQLMVNASVVQVPVFYGQGLSLSIETREPVSAEWVRELLKQSPAVEVLEGDQLPTPQDLNQQADKLFAGRIREDLSHGSGINLWLVADDIRFSAVGNCLNSARKLIEEYY